MCIHTSLCHLVDILKRPLATQLRINDYSRRVIFSEGSSISMSISIFYIRSLPNVLYQITLNILKRPLATHLGVNDYSRGVYSQKAARDHMYYIKSLYQITISNHYIKL